MCVSARGGIGRRVDEKRDRSFEGTVSAARRSTSILNHLARHPVHSQQCHPRKKKGVSKDGRAYHCLITARHVTVRECKVVDEQCANDNNSRGEQYAKADTFVDNPFVLFPRRLAHHGAIDRIDAKRLARGT